jgi:hypothetical protein
VDPPGSEDFEATATAWLLELLPHLHSHTVRRYPAALAAIARHVTAGAVDGGRLAAAAKSAELVEFALRGEPL